MKEIWKNIFNDNYAVSNKGKIRANDRIVKSTTGKRHYRERILSPEIVKDGHLRVVLCNNGIKQHYFVHRLVAEAFIPNPNNLPIINHKDENPANNNVDNLEWCTWAYNNAYNNRHERIGDAEGHTIDVYDLSGNFIKQFPSITKAAKFYNISLTTLWRYVKNNRPIQDKIFIKHSSL